MKIDSDKTEQKPQFSLLIEWVEKTKSLEKSKLKIKLF